MGALDVVVGTAPFPDPYDSRATRSLHFFAARDAHKILRVSPLTIGQDVVVQTDDDGVAGIALHEVEQYVT